MAHRTSFGQGFRYLFAAFAATLLGGCTYGMHDAVFGHGDGPKESPQEMARKADIALQQFEDHCFSGKAVWQRVTQDAATCSFRIVSHWGFWDGTTDYFEMTTRGVPVFIERVGARYPAQVAGEANGGSTGFYKSSGRTYQYAWRYVLGDGRVTLSLDRDWEHNWNEFETAVVREDATVTLTLKARHACLKDAGPWPQVQKTAACPGIRGSMQADAAQLALEDIARIAQASEDVNGELRGIAQSREESAAAHARLAAYEADRARASQQAIDRGIRQGLGNLMNEAVEGPAYQSQAQREFYAQAVALSHMKISQQYEARMRTQQQVLDQVAAQRAATQATAGGAAAPGTAATPSASAQPAAGAPMPQATGQNQAALSDPNLPAAPAMEQHQEAMAVCWQSKLGKTQDVDAWFCHGPVQKTLAAETHAVALQRVGCPMRDPDSSGWRAGDNVYHACGFGLEPYDERVADQYSPPSEFLRRLHTYECPKNHSARCASAI